jgi:phospholipid/cholesterol/gamma-HCH transport system substrate-binding protein
MTSRGLRVRCVRNATAVALALVVVAGLSGCGWHGLNSLPMPGTAGGGPGSFTIQAQLPNVTNLQPNSRVRVNDVTVGNVTEVEMQGWHALLTMTLDRDVDLPANATVKLGQTSLFGSLHVELAPPTSEPPQGKLHDGSLIPLAAASTYPSTEQTLAAISLVLNGGGVGQVQDITEALSTAFAGRADDLRSLIVQLDKYVGYLNDQKDDIIAAADSLNNLVGQIAAQKPVVDKALKTIPDALAVLSDQRKTIADAINQLGKFSALTADTVNQTKAALVQELTDVGPVLKSLADAGPALTRALGVLPTYPFPKDTLTKWNRGDYANLTAVIDLTLSRLDSSFFTGTRWEGDLTELEMQWGRTIGQLPSPYTAVNPLVVPYIPDQGS